MATCSPADSAPPPDPSSPSSLAVEIIKEDLADIRQFDHLRADADEEPVEDDDQDEDVDQEEDDEADDNETDEGSEAEDSDLRIVALPVLTEDVLLDEDVLDIAVGAVVDASTVAQDMQAEIDLLLAELQENVSPTAFAVVMRAMEMAQARLLVVAPIVAAWAWSEGHACREEL